MRNLQPQDTARMNSGIGRLQRTVKVGSRRSAVDEKIASCDKCPFVTEKQFCHICHFVGCAGTSGRTPGKHIFIEIASGTVEFVYGKGRYDDPRGDGIDPGSLLSPLDCFCHNPFFIAAFCHLVSVEGILDLRRLQ